MSKFIVFTGGGSGGHLFPALSLIEELQKRPSSPEILFIGGNRGIESEVVPSRGIPYFGISNGKLRRYFSLENFFDFFRFFAGVFQAGRILLNIPRNSLIFSTGGFVGLPVVIAGFILGRRMFLHEQTSRAGLANKIASYLVDKVLLSFPSSASFFPKHKSVITGYPLRPQIFRSFNEGDLIDFDLPEGHKPVLFVTGGGNGSEFINQLLMKNLDVLVKHYFVIHQTGKRHFSKYENFKRENYLPLAFLKDMISVYKVSEAIISRAGAGTVAELMALKKKTVFIPLKIAQKNEQYFNALEARGRLGSIIIEEDEAHNINLLSTLTALKEKRNTQNLQVKKTKDFIENGLENILAHL